MQDIIIRAVCRTLLHSLWQGLLLALVAGLLLILARKSGAALRYNVLGILLIAFTIAVSATFYIELQTLQAGAMAGSLPVQAAAAPGMANPLTGLVQKTNLLHDIIASAGAYFDAHAYLVVFAWFCFFLTRFVKIISGLVNIQRMRHYGTSPVNPPWEDRLILLKNRLSVSKPVLLLESAIIKIPMTLGWLKPVILVPAGMLSRLSPGQVEAVLLHELAHIRRRDYFVNICQRLLETIFFFNPAVLWVSSIARNERENCCDDMAIRETRSRKQYIEALVSFYRPTQAGNGYALSFASRGKHQLLNRVLRIAGKKNEALRRGETIVLVVILMASGTAFVTLNNSCPVVPVADPHVVLTGTNQAKVKDARATVQLEPVNAKKKAGGNHQVKKTDELKKLPGIPGMIKSDTADSENNEPVGDDTMVFRKQLQLLGFATPGDDNALQYFRDHGLTANYISAFLKAGYRDISLSRFVEIIDHGVDMKFINGFRNMGYAPINIDKAIEIIDHGVTPAFIRNFIKLGFKNISIDKAIELQDHGVNSDYILAIQKKTGSLFTLDEYINFIDSGISLS